LNLSGIAWALGGALRLAIATAVIALVLATTLSGEGAERLATTAYLAGIFAAIALAIQRFLPAAADEPRAISAHAFPAFLAFFFGVAVFLGAGTALVSQPGAEALVFVGCFGLVVLAVLVRSGTVAAANATLVRGGVTVAATRYAAVIGVCALAFAALLPSDPAESVANIAYRLMIAATVFVAASLIAPTRLGLFVQRYYARLFRLLDRLAHEFVFERTASYAAVVGVALLIPASLLPGRYAEPFVIVAFGAAVAATFGVAMECRRLRG
jgi:hypothetical protein